MMMSRFYEVELPALYKFNKLMFLDDYDYKHVVHAQPLASCPTIVKGV